MKKFLRLALRIIATFLYAPILAFGLFFLIITVIRPFEKYTSESVTWSVTYYESFAAFIFYPLVIGLIIVLFLLIKNRYKKLREEVSSKVIRVACISGFLVACWLTIGVSLFIGDFS